MTELTPEGRRLLDQVRSVDDPTPQERASGDAAVRRMLKAHGMQSPPPLQPTAARERPRFAAHSGTPLKLAGVFGAAVLGALAVFGYQAQQSSHAATASHATEPAPQKLSTAPAQRVADAAPMNATSEAPEALKAARPAAPSARPAPHKNHGKADSSLADELRFVTSVDADIRAGAYDRALTRLQERRGASLLQEERAAMRVLALCGRDPDSHAMHERERFLKRSPSSVLSARVRAACGGGGSP